MKMKKDIKYFRVINNLTQNDLATIIGCSTNAYIQKEKGRVDFTVNEIKIVKAYFNLSVEQTWHLFFEEDVNENEI